MSPFNFYHDFQIIHADYENAVRKEFFENEIFDDLTKLVDEYVISRISSFACGLIIALASGFEHMTYAIDNFSQGMLAGDVYQILFAGKHVLQALVDAVALFTLGIIGVVMPKTAYKIAGRIGAYIGDENGPYAKGDNKIPDGIGIRDRVFLVINGFTTGLRELKDSFILITLSPFMQESCETASDGFKNLKNVVIVPIVGIRIAITGK